MLYIRIYIYNIHTYENVPAKFWVNLAVIQVRNSTNTQTVIKFNDILSMRIGGFTVLQFSSMKKTDKLQNS